MEPSEKRRKVDKECRKFNEEWTTKYFFIEWKSKALCLICRETVAILKDLNRHYETKHNASGENLSENNRMKQITALRESLQKQHVMISLTCVSQELVTDASLVVAYKLAKHKPFSDREFVKECMDATVKIICPEVEMRLKKVSLSRRTIVRIVDSISTNLADQLASKIKKFHYFSICLDERTDVMDTAQMLICISKIDRDFNVTEELLSMESLKHTTGEDLFRHLCDCIDRHKLHWDKLVSITTDGAPSLTGKNVALVKKVNDEVSGMYPGRKVIPLHCNIHQESSCKSVLHVKHVVDPAVKAVNHIRSKGLNHPQFLSFLDDMESEHTHIIFYNSVRWLSLGKMLRRVWDLQKDILIFWK